MRVAAVRRVGILFLAFAWAADLAAAECVAAPPLTLSGKLHGKTIDISGAAVPNAGLRVLDLQGVVKAEFQSNSKGVFVFDFSSLPRGEYELVTTVPEFRSRIA